MRINLPVTQREFEVPDGVTLVSTTDLKGRITYANPNFIAVSGYTRDELIGQPHNIVRHPDMPAEAFRDMWATLAQGKPWSAPVKNRRKNGDHYWVMANATPIQENGRTAGYMSVRTKPTREQIQQAEGLYTRMRDEAAVGRVSLALNSGHVVRTGWTGRMQHWVQPTLGKKLVALALGLAFTVQFIDHFTQGQPEWVHIAAFGVTAGLAIAVATLMWRQTVAPVARLVAFANQMAAGNLAARLEVRGHDEFGELMQGLNQLNVNLQAVVTDVRHEVDGVQVASREIANGNHDLSARTESQASNLEQTAASMEQLTTTIEQSTAFAQQASKLADRAADVTRQGNEAMEQVISTMDEISRSSQRISEIIQVIEGISFQTNILALNAAVEAARAGDQGRGFAVVAAEVRSLAQRTSTAAKEIKQLIGESSEQVARGGERVQSTGQTMAQVVSEVQQVRALITEITGASLEQSSGLSQINHAVDQLDSVTQQNSAMVEQLAAAASSLQTQADVMQEAVRIFRIQH